MNRFQSLTRVLKSTRNLRDAPLLSHMRRYSTQQAWPSHRASFTWLGALGLSGVLFSVYSAKNVTKADVEGFNPLIKPFSTCIGAKEVQENDWVVIDGTVYDITTFASIHPGGEEVLQEAKGTDISTTFHALHSEEALSNALGASQLKLIGTLRNKSEVPKFDLDEHLVEQRRKELPPVHTITNLATFEKLAKDVLGANSRAWHFISSVSEDGITFKSNREAYSFLRFLPRVNRPVEEGSIETEFLGTKVPMPVFMSPTGGSGNAHPNGELNATRASAATGVPQIVSSMSSVSFSALADTRDHLVRGGNSRAHLWWQLYIMKDRAESEKRIRSAAHKGAEAIVITVDVATPGKREVAGQSFQGDGRKNQSTRKEDNGRNEELAGIKPSFFTADMTWSDIDWVKSIAPGLPILVKGIATVEDMALAKESGADGVILSNHGGRQLDWAPPPLATLTQARLTNPNLLEDPDFQVYLDGGVQRGTDILKALCVGARGVGLGRSVLYAQACYGAEGVTRLFESCQTISELNPSLVELLDGGLVGKRL